MLLFSLDPDSIFSQTLAASLAVPLAPLEERIFEDGEHKLRPLLNPHGADTYIVASLHGGPLYSPHDKLCRLLLLIATLREHGAARITAVLPYLAYARKDRQTKPFDPLSLRYVAQLFEAVGTAHLMVLEAHNVAAFQNAFRCRSTHLEAHRIFDGLVAELAGDDALVVASPDPGGVKRAQLWRDSIELLQKRRVGFAMLDKRRSAGILSSENLLAGEVREMTVLLLDDLIASGETMQRAAQTLLAAGARKIIVCAAHGLFTGKADQNLSEQGIEKIIVTDSVPSFRLPSDAPLRNKLRFASAAPLFAQAIRANHEIWLR